ncbi:MAG TPA: 6-phosphofructokinase, partial [Candidatus Binataceae bacterium]|nr:6-phosphofructokinase [Candidatus Binataceae bacterium]
MIRRDNNAQQTLAILVGGGPAPGINGVIASATIEAINCGMRVLGLRDGYRWLAEGDITHIVELKIPDVSRIHFSGGSVLRTSRTNPARDEATLDRVVRSLTMLGVRYLVCVGGDDTTFGAARIAERMQGRIGVATVPKTIDNDLPLPENAPTFGFETARAVGATIIESLMEDARTTSRWYIAVSMGRKSGSLALSMCKSAGATLAVIPEEFHGDQFDLSLAVDTIIGAIIKRRASGHDNGVAVLAEGVAERLDMSSLQAGNGSDRDAYGHVHIADIPLGMLIRDRVRGELRNLGIDATVVAKDIGYELRCAKPVPFDTEYTRTLGYGAVRYLLGGGSGALIAITGGRVTPVELQELTDPETGRIRVRMVDVST